MFIVLIISGLVSVLIGGILLTFFVLGTLAQSPFLRNDPRIGLIGLIWFITGLTTVEAAIEKEYPTSSQVESEVKCEE